LLSREEIEGELRDVFAKMSLVELEGELKGAWRELVEEELASRREASQLEQNEASQIAEIPMEESLTPDAPAAAGVAFIDAAPSAPPLPETKWKSRIARFLRAIFKKQDQSR
jgi:hypothetical protein